MKSRSQHSKLFILFLASRPKFLLASVAPVLVGSALGYATAGTFSVHLFILALIGIMALHSGANLANDYFDHVSGNDWFNLNPTPFSGGSRYIQDGILSPKVILLSAFVALTIGSIIGMVIFLLTQSIFILILGLIGLLGGFFYTAPPIKLGYRYIGEFIIALLFGILPIYGSYYLQSRMIDTTPIFPAIIAGILIFLVILVNEFPDLKADAAVSKKTLIVAFGVPVCIWIYRGMLTASFIIAAIAMAYYQSMFYAGLLYLFTLPIAIVAMRFVNKEDLTPVLSCPPPRLATGDAGAGESKNGGRYRASQVTIFLHAVGSFALAVGFIISSILVRAKALP